MFVRLAGYLSIVLGVLWVFKPEWLRNWFLRKTWWCLFWIVISVLGYPLVYAGKRAGMTGVVLILFLFLLGMKIMGSALRGAFEKFPLVSFRAVGLVNILIGIALVR